MVGRRRAVAGVFGALLAATACGGDDDADGLRPVVGQVPTAVAALEAELGGPQRYFEINATPQLVNLFVADVDAPGTVTPYLYADGALQEPAPSQPVTAGTPFVAADMAEDLHGLLAGITRDLPDSDITTFVVYSASDGSPRYSATVTSEQGGVIDVELSPDGVPIVDVAD